MAGRGRRHDLRALEMIGELDQRAGREHVDILRRPGGFATARLRADQPVPARIGGDRRGQNAGDRGDRAIKRQFAENL